MPLNESRLKQIETELKEVFLLHAKQELQDMMINHDLVFRGDNEEMIRAIKDRVPFSEVSDVGFPGTHSLDLEATVDWDRVPAWLGQRGVAVWDDRISSSPPELEEAQKIVTSRLREMVEAGFLSDQVDAFRNSIRDSIYDFLKSLDKVSYTGDVPQQIVDRCQKAINAYFEKEKPPMEVSYCQDEVTVTACDNGCADCQCDREPVIDIDEANLYKCETCRHYNFLHCWCELPGKEGCKELNNTCGAWKYYKKECCDGAP